MDAGMTLQKLPTGIESSLAVFESTDPTFAGDGFEILDQDIVKLETGPYKAKRAIVNLDGMLFIYQSVNQRVRTFTKLHDDFMVFTVLGSRSRCLVDGRLVASECLAVAEPGFKMEFVVESGYESISCLVSPDELTNQLRKRGCGKNFRIPVGMEIYRVNPSRVKAVFNRVKRLVGNKDSIPAAAGEDQKVFNAANINLFNTMIEVLEPGERASLSRRDQTRKTYGSIVRQVQEYALANIGDALQTADLCNFAGVSERTLQYAFQEILNLSPIAFLTRLRLHRARRTLRAENRETTTVSAVAAEWGFWHFGEFSRAYKNCFGELPSDTLNRRP